MAPQPRVVFQAWNTHERRTALWAIALGALTGSAFEMTVDVIQSASWQSFASWLPLFVPILAFLAGLVGHRASVLVDEANSEREGVQMALMHARAIIYQEKLDEATRKEKLSEIDEKAEKKLSELQDTRINASRRSLGSSIGLGALALSAALIISAVMPSEATSGSQHPQLEASCQPCALTPGESARITFRVTGAERVFVDSMQVDPSLVTGLEVAPETSHSYLVEAYNQHGMSRVVVYVAVIQ